MAPLPICVTTPPQTAPGMGCMDGRCECGPVGVASGVDVDELRVDLHDWSKPYAHALRRARGACCAPGCRLATNWCTMLRPSSVLRSRHTPSEPAIVLFAGYTLGHAAEQIAPGRLDADHPWPISPRRSQPSGPAMTVARSSTVTPPAGAWVEARSRSRRVVAVGAVQRRQHLLRVLPGSGAGP